MRMRHGKVLVKELAPPKETKGGILLTEDQGVKSYKGIVIDTAPTVDLEPGQTVIFSEYAGTKIILNGTPFLIIDDENLWGVEDAHTNNE